jgi:hypothetical protein
MTFVSWLKKNYKDDDSPIGDFVKDMIEDFKINNLTIKSYTKLKQRLEGFDYCVSQNALDALDKAYLIYKQSIKVKKECLV